MRFRSLFSALALFLVCTVARGAVTFEIDADWVTNSTNNTGIPDGSVFFLVADTQNNGFTLPTMGHFFAGKLWGGSTDDIVIASFAASGFIGTPGVQQTTISNLDYSSFTNATVSAGDHVGLFWFPTINYNNSGNTQITGLATYGYFDTLSAGSDAASWSLPPDVTSDKVFTFATSNAQIFPSGSDIPTYGVVVPEPSTFALLSGAASLSFAFIIRRRQAG